jgi:hypothetical protein
MINAERAGKAFGMDKGSLREYYNQMLNTVMDEDLATGWAGHSDLVQALDAGMEKTKKDAFLYRVANPEFFGKKGELTKEDIGRVFKDHAFTSTEGEPTYFNGKGPADLQTGLNLEARPYRMVIHAPAGTLARRVNDFEREILLSRGSSFQILDVMDEPEGNLFRKTVHLYLTGQDDLLNKKHSTRKKGWVDDFNEAKDFDPTDIFAGIDFGDFGF